MHGICALMWQYIMNVGMVCNRIEHLMVFVCIHNRTHIVCSALSWPPLTMCGGNQIDILHGHPIRLNCATNPSYNPSPPPPFCLGHSMYSLCYFYEQKVLQMRPKGALHV